MIRSFVLIFLSATFFTAAAWAGPILPKQIDGRAQWLVHADIDAFLTSPIGVSLRGELQKFGIDRKLAALEAMFSFDPMRDLRGITIYGSGYDDHDGVVLLAGNFDVEKLTILLRASDAYQKMEYAGHEVHHWIDHHPLLSDDNVNDAASALNSLTDLNVESANEARHMYGTFYQPTLVVLAGDFKTLKSAIDVLDARRPTLTTANTFVAQRARPTDGAFLQVVADGFAEVPDAAPKAALLKKTQRFALVFGQTAETLFVDATLTAADAEIAQQIETLLQGMIASVLLSNDEWPELAVAMRTATVSRNDTAIVGRMT